MSRRLEFGWLLDDGTYLCDGCSVREGHEHRCHGDDGSYMDGHTCACEECAGFAAWMASQRDGS